MVVIPTIPGSVKISRIKRRWRPVSVVLLMVILFGQSCDSVHYTYEYNEKTEELEKQHFRIVATSHCDNYHKHVQDSKINLTEEQMDYCPYFKFVRVNNDFACCNENNKESAPLFKYKVYEARGLYGPAKDEILQPPFVLDVPGMGFDVQVQIGHKTYPPSSCLKKQKENSECKKYSDVGFFAKQDVCWVWHMWMPNHYLNYTTCIICPSSKDMDYNKVENVILAVRGTHRTFRPVRFCQTPCLERRNDD